MNPTASGARSVAVTHMSGGTIMTGDINIFIEGIYTLRTDYAGRIKRFLEEYISTPQRPVAFGGRAESLNLLNAWLDSTTEPPYLLLTAHAGQGKSALLAHWCQSLITRDKLAVAFIPISIRFRTNLASVVFPAVTARLAALHGEPVAANVGTPVEVWRAMMSDYLARPLPFGRRLLLVLDGLDEAADWEAGSDLFSSIPPSALRIVASARPRVGEADGCSWLSSLGWDRPGLGRSMDLPKLTLDGVRDVLIRMGCPLDELGRRDEIVGQLYRLSDGEPLVVRLYVEDLWQRKDAAPRLKPENLSAIPPGLKGYLQQWWKQQEALWESRGVDPLEKPMVRLLLQVLAFAMGPLSRKDLAHLVARGFPDVRSDSILLKSALLCLDRLVIGDGKDQGYVFSHPRLAFHFADEFEEDRISTETLILAWGNEQLEALDAGTSLPHQASAYLVQYLGAHLERASRPESELLRLVSKGWQRAWEALEGGHEGFISDVRRAWRVAAHRNSAQASVGEGVPGIGAEVLCALCESSVHGLASNIRPELAKAALVQKVWTASQALGHARLIARASSRMAMLAFIIPHLPEHLRLQALEEAISTLQQIDDPEEKVRAILSVVPFLAPLKRQSALEDGLTAASATEYQENRAAVLASLGPYLSPVQAARGIEIARGIDSAEHRARALAALAAAVTGEETRVEQILAELVNAGEPTIACRAAAAMAPSLSGRWSAALLRIANGAPNMLHRCRVMAAVAPHLPDAQREALTKDILIAARQIMKGDDRFEVLTALVPLLPLPARKELVQEALEAFSKVEIAPDYSAQLLIAMLPHLDGNLVEEVLTAARAIQEPHSRVEVLTAIIPLLPESQQAAILEEAMQATRSFAYYLEYVQPSALAELARHMPEPRRAEVLAEALVAAQAIGDDFHRYNCIEHIAPYLPVELLTRALSTARSIHDEGHIALSLAAISRHLPPEEYEPYVDASLSTAIEAQRMFRDRSERLLTLAELPRYASSPLRPKVNAVLVEIMATARQWGGGDFLTAVLNCCVLHLPDSLVAEAVGMANEFGDEDRTLSEWLNTLAPRLRGDLLLKALSTSRSIKNLRDRVLTEAALAGRLPDGPRRRLSLHRALGMIEGFESPSARAQILVKLAVHLQNPEQQQLLAAALELAARAKEESSRRDILLGAAASVDGLLAERARSLGLGLDDAGYRSEALAALSRWLDDAQINAVFSDLPQIGGDGRKAEALVALAPYLPERLLLRAVQMAFALESYYRAKALAALSPRFLALPISELYGIWAKELPVLAKNRREYLLEDLRALAPLIHRLGGTLAAAAAFSAIKRAGEWWP